jgi:three-Cys-motif partner protein
MATDRRTYLLTHADPLPDLPVECGVQGKGVGPWVPREKHRLLADYIEATHGARGKWPNRVLVDLFSGPGRVQVEGESATRDGGAVVAWRQSARVPRAAFTQMIVGDLDPARSQACGARLRAVGAPATVLTGPAASTCIQALSQVDAKGSLCLAYLDPYNLQYLSFDIIRTLAKRPKIDFAVHFSTMDFTRNLELEFVRGRFDDAIPGWADRIDPRTLSRNQLREAVFEYWCKLIRGLGFNFSKRMPLIRDERNKPLYRLVFFSRSELPTGIWDDVAKGQTGELF